MRMLWTRARLGRVDWSRTNAELAWGHGIAIDRMSILRGRARRLGIAAPTIHALRWEERKARCLRAGMGRLADTDVARRLGISREAVRQARVRAGLPPPVAGTEAARNRARREIARRRIAESIATFGARVRRLAKTGLSAAEIARRLGISSGRVERMARAMRIRIERKGWTLSQWSRVNWRLPGVEIARRIGRSLGSVHRMRMVLRRKGYAVPRDPRYRGARA